MTDSGPVRPRRAFAPLDDDQADANPTPTGRRGLRALSPESAAALDDAETRVLRRVMLSDSPESPITPESPVSPASPASADDAFQRVWSPTPVPPPRPVLPNSSTLPASAGRRFSASDSPPEVSYSPRRSATSVSSPPEHLFVASRPAAEPQSVPSRPSQPATEPNPPAPRATPLSAEPEPLRAAPATDADPTPARRSGKRALIVLAAVAAIGGLVFGGITWLAPNAPASLTPTQAPPSPSLDPLLTADDLGSLGATSWVTVAAAPEGGDGNPVCLPVTADNLPTADRTDRRVLTSDTSSVDYVNHVVDSYPDRASAAQAYQQRLLQAGACADTVALIVNSYNVTSLADNAFVTQLQVQGETVRNHTVLVSQTGRNLSMIDVSDASPISPESVVAVATKPLSRLCGGGQGSCPTTPEVVPSVPAAGQNPGWLVEADLPRITPGAGRWAASPIDSKLTIVGSQCEAVTLKKVEGVTASAQRTLLLADDPAAPTVFGVDQVVYTFPDAKAAKSFADKVTDNIADCAKTVPTATVAKGPNAKGEGAEAIDYSGKSFLVTQDTGTEKSALYRVGVVRIGERVAYLLANPSADFDFTDAQWKAILERTGERVSQTP
ncbi:MAG: hypothetical protein QM804_03410 [Propionicimonas sp.]